MKLDHVAAFVGTCGRGSFTGASATRRLSQPAIRRRAHLLERERGAPLFERIPSGVVLTDAARAFPPHAEAPLASVRDGLDAVTALRAGARGPSRWPARGATRAAGRGTTGTQAGVKRSSPSR